jgi:HSP20 family protein
MVKTKMIKKSSLILGLGLLMAGTALTSAHALEPTGRHPQTLFSDAFWHDFEQSFENRFSNFGSSASVEKDKITLTYDVPGLSSKDVTVMVENSHTLLIKGEKKEKVDEKEKGKEVHYRSARSFHKSMTLPKDAEFAKISAEVKDGVLTVIIPRKPLPPETTHKVVVK